MSDETACHFVCSRGILKSCTFHSPAPTSSCATDTRYLDAVPLTCAAGDSIYVCSEALGYFIDRIMPRIRQPFVLVTGDSDLTVPTDAINLDQTMALMNNLLLLRWFAQNTVVRGHPKIVQMPIGLDYHTIASFGPGHRWSLAGEGVTPVEQEAVLRGIHGGDRIPKIYVNFGAFDKYGDRNSAMSTIPKELMTVHLKQVPRTLVWKFMAKHAFVLSPFGNGMDCHRTWEALVLGAIPIVRGHQFDELFADLPVLIVDEWKDVTAELLTATLEAFKGRSFKKERLELAYWKKQIASM